MTAYTATYANIFKVTSGGTVAIGTNALSSQTTSGTYNTCIGQDAGNTITSGTLNTVVGYSGDVAVGTGRATVIGSTATLPVSNATSLSVAIGYGATTTNTGVCVLGNPSDQVRPHLLFSHTSIKDRP